MGYYGDAYFSPPRGTAEVIIGFIDRTEQTLDCAVYSITHDAIADALIRAHRRGVKVRVLTDKVQASSRYADDERLLEAGIEVRRDTQSGSMHTKFALSDGKAVGNGSFNWTKNADTRNAEHWTVLRLLYMVRDFQKQFDILWEKNAPAPGAG